jgi:hypothetical protein
MTLTFARFAKVLGAVLVRTLKDTARDQAISLTLKAAASALKNDQPKTPSSDPKA